MISEDADYIRFRISQARETMADAIVLFEGGSMLSVVNRLYYACFYAVSALVYTEGLRPRKHSGLLSAFGQGWIKTGRLPAHTGKFYRSLFNMRMKSDYGDEAPPTRETMRQLIDDAQTFLDEIAGHIEKHLYK